MVNFSGLADRVLDLAMQIQQIPAPTFRERPRSEYVRQLFEQEAVADVSCDELDNVYARLPGHGTARPLVISAHLDTVFPDSTDLTLKREDKKIFGPGIGDNSLGVAGLLGVIWALRERRAQLPGDVWLVANTGEEGLGDLRGMRGVVDRFGRQPLAYIVLEGMALGQVYHRGLGVRRYRIHARTPGGHSWVDFGRPSAIHELAALVVKMTAIAIPARPRTSLNVGVIAGGTTVNTIAAEAHCELDLRSEHPDALDDLTRKVEELVNAANHNGVKITVEIIGHRPAGEISPVHPLVNLARRSLELQSIAPSLSIGSTDANIPLSLGLPSVCIGLSTGGGAHTVDEFIHTSRVSAGLAQVVSLLEGAFQALS